MNEHWADLFVGRSPNISYLPGVYSYIHWIIEKAREFQKNIYFCFIEYAKVFDYMDQNKLWKILTEKGIPDPPYLPPKKPACRSASNS